MKLNKVLITILSMSTIFTSTIVPTFANNNNIDSISNYGASTKLENRPYVIVNGTHIVYEGEDYENPTTGEYIRWNNSRGIDKEFEFKVRYSVMSSPFKINSDRVNVSANAYIENLDGKIQPDYDGHLYTVEIVGLYQRKLQFSVGNSQAGTINGLKEGEDYRVRITNNEYLDSTKYLVGSGTVESL